MIHFIKKLFGESETTEEKQKQSKEKQFDILKYDGIRALRIGKAEYAAKCLEEAVALKEDAEAYNYLITAYVQINKMEEACQLLTNLLEKEPENIDYHIALANLFFMQEDYKNMLATLQLAERINSKHPLVHYLLAKAQHGLHNELQTIAELTQAIALREDFKEAYLMRAIVLLEMHQTEDAEKDADKLHELAPDDEQSLILLGKVHYMKGDSDLAKEYWNRVTETNPFNEEAYIGIVQLLAEEKKWEEALAKLNEAIEANPESATLYLQRGHIKLIMDDKEGSAEDLKKSLELNPEKEQQISGEFHNFEKPYKIDNHL